MKLSNSAETIFKIKTKYEDLLKTGKGVKFDTNLIPFLMRM